MANGKWQISLFMSLTKHEDQICKVCAHQQILPPEFGSLQLLQSYHVPFHMVENTWCSVNVHCLVYLFLFLKVTS